MTMSTRSIFSRFSLALGTLWLMHCGSESPVPGATMCPDGTTSAHCAPMTCIDKSKNGAETDVDCGGPTCGKCTVNQSCTVGSDCDTGLCTAGVCKSIAAPSCTDSIKNGTETAIDCGGTACNKCAIGLTCATANDCLSATCTGGLCVPAPATCTDRIKNGNETDVDCGGPTCNVCSIGQICLAARDCVSATCSGGRCVTAPPTCTDGIKNGSETDVDCGGPTCNKCANTKMCLAASDCTSATCTAGICVAPPNMCMDGIKNGSETDVDCGGPTCTACANTKFCVAARDCISTACVNLQCALVLGICTYSPIPGLTIGLPMTNPPYANVSAAQMACTTTYKGTFK